MDKLTPLIIISAEAFIIGLLYRKLLFYRAFYRNPVITRDDLTGASTESLEQLREDILDELEERIETKSS